MLSSRSGLSQADVFITLWQMANSDYVNSQKSFFFFFNLKTNSIFKEFRRLKNNILQTWHLEIQICWAVFKAWSFRELTANFEPFIIYGV